MITIVAVLGAGYYGMRICSYAPVPRLYPAPNDLPSGKLG